MRGRVPAPRYPHRRGSAGRRVGTPAPVLARNLAAMANRSGSSSGKAASRRTPSRTTGRVTPKGTAPRGTAKAPAPKATAAPASSRYTPPVRKEVKVSPPWVPILMFGLLGLGVLLIILNYLEVLPGGSDNRYLLAGLAAITGGFITATQYR